MAAHTTPIILDQKMPGLDGLQTLRLIRERTPEARVLMVTAYASIELAVDAMKLGATTSFGNR
jgi:DNA-binding NtrC family response regulator